ncbi:MAG: hypothetical protein AAFP99_04335 [Pseudomonadota bacterium]
MMRSLLLAAVFAAFAYAHAAHARDVSAAEKQALVAAINAFDAAMTGEDYETVIDASITPAMMKFIADQNGATVEQLRPAVVAQISALMGAIQVDAFSMDTSNIEYKQTDDGTPYAMIDTVTEMTSGSQKIKATGQTLGLREDGKWYLVRVSEQQQANMLKAVYPRFNNVVFPAGKMETTDQ